MAGDASSASSRIFISYRRDDAQWPVEALYQKLQQHFGDRIFKDTDNIAPGQDFAEVINRELESCSVLLAVIGARWLTAADPKLKRPRLENPTDTLRLEISTALKNERVLVIPVLVDGASMPGSDDLPSDLDPLARRNGIDIGVGSKFDGDVNRLIKAIERATGMTGTAKRQPAPAAVIDVREPADEPATEEFNLREIRRRRQIADHVRAAQTAFEAQNYEAVLDASDRVLFLDPQEPTARTLHRQARAALDNSKIQKWLGEAEKILGREPLEDTDLGRASELVDDALALNAAHDAAVKLRQEVLSLRKKRERHREIAKQVHAVLSRAQSCLDEEDFDGAIEFCDDALLLSEESVEARDLRARAVAAKDEEKREKDLKRRAQQAVKEAREDFAAGRCDAALARLEQFSPPHDLVERALDGLRDEMDARALAEVAGVRRQFASGEHQAAIAKLEEFRPPHAAVTRALTDLRAELQQIVDRQKEEEARQAEERRQQEEEQRRAEEARRLEAEAQAAREQRRAQVAGKIAESAASLGRRDFEPALTHAHAALTLDPSSTDARRAFEQAEKALAVQKEVATGLRDVRSLVKSARFAAAIETLEKLSALDPLAEGLGALREEAEAGQRTERLRHEIDEQLGVARKARATGNLQSALEATRVALGRDATHAGAVELERELQAAIQAEETARIQTLELRKKEEEAARRREEEEARRKEETAPKEKEEADRKARDAKAQEEARRKEETARKEKEEADRKARDAKAQEEARRKEETARKEKEEADRKARDAKAQEEARRKEETARKEKEEADRKARDAKAQEEARRKEETARKEKEEADRKARDAKAQEEARRKEETARKEKEEADRKAREARAREEAAAKQEARRQEEARRQPQEPIRPEVSEEPAPEPEPKKLPIVAIAGGIGAIAAAILLVVWLRSGPADNPSTSPATTSNAGTSSSSTPGKTDTPPTKPDNPPVVAGTKAEPATTTPPASETTPPKATTPEPATSAPATTVDPSVVQLQGLRTAAKDQWQRGDHPGAANSLLSATKVAPGDPETRALAMDLMRQSRERMNEARKAARDAKAQLTQAFKDAETKAEEGNGFSPARATGPKSKPVEAFRAFGEATDLFKKAAAEAAATPAPIVTPPGTPPSTTVTIPNPSAEVKPSGAPPKAEAPPPTSKAAEPVSPPSKSPVKPSSPSTPGGTSSTPPAGSGSSSASTTTPPPVTPAPGSAAPQIQINDDAEIRRTIGLYEAAWIARDPGALARVQMLSASEIKSVTTAFKGYKQVRLTIRIESIAVLPDGLQAIVKGQAHRVLDPTGGGGQIDRTMPITFKMQKVSGSWKIASLGT